MINKSIGFGSTFSFRSSVGRFSPAISAASFERTSGILPLIADGLRKEGKTVTLARRGNCKNQGDLGEGFSAVPFNGSEIKTGNPVDLYHHIVFLDGKSTEYELEIAHDKNVGLDSYARTAVEMLTGKSQVRT